ncbi:MAG: hypothetical protein ACYDBB_20020 [Armatimonadota bacterium]
MLRSLTLVTCLGLLMSLIPAYGQTPQAFKLAFTQAQTAGISGFRTKWDTPLPNELVFDAVHRSLLVRFPGSAGQIAAQCAKGYAVQKVELVLPFKDTEYNSTETAGYFQYMSFGVAELYQKVLPQWHAVAWPLRKPWTADKDLGPTYNASINGAAYWAHFGAQDTKKDRFSRQFGPTEVSYKQTEGRMNVTAMLTDTSFGKTVAARLRMLEDCGFLLKKWEQYDFRFRKSGDGAYEWGVATGGRGILLNAPRLEVTFAPTGKVSAIGALAPAANIPALVAAVKKRGVADGKPTAVMPTPEELVKIVKRYALTRPAGIPDWQWKRIQELDALGGAQLMPSDPKKFTEWIDWMLSQAPRVWGGWDVEDRLLIMLYYRDALPAPVQEHWLNYWMAWIMPDRPTSQFDHPQAVEIYYNGKNKYYDETGDWRGNVSNYRGGYCYQMSTIGFNHFSAVGALLGGKLIGSKDAMADGRHGLEYWPLRMWAWYDGSMQTSIDHYYMPLTMSTQKMFADFGPTHMDRMMGQSLLTKSMEELTTLYHPGLRRFIATSSRTSVPQYWLISQDGAQHIVHTLSPRGALHDLSNPDIPGNMPVIGQEATPPNRIAKMTELGPWAPEWVSHIVEDKALPFSSTAAFKRWGEHAANPLWRRAYLGKHYGLATMDLTNEIVAIMGQWRREDKPVERVQEIGTLDLRYGINSTSFVNDSYGWREQQGNTASLQWKNKLVTVTSPFKMTGREGVKTLQSAIALYNYQAPLPNWEIFVDGQRVTQLPFKAKQGQRITIHDGVSYLGIIPLPAIDLGRTDEVVLSEGIEQKWQYPTKPALVINSYNLQRDTPLPKDADWTPIDRAYGGFVVEFGDVTEYGNFAAFQQHMADSKLTTRWEPETLTLHTAYQSGKDLLEMGAKVEYAENAPSPTAFTYRRVNGAWPYLPEGILRDTDVSIQGTTGRLEKNGAVLTSEPGCTTYLQTELVTGTYAAYNPLPDPTLWALSVPGGVQVKTDGRVSLLRCVVRPKENKLWVDYAAKEEQTGSAMATALLVFGLPGAPTVELNGMPFTVKLATVKLEGRSAYVIPLKGSLSKEALTSLPARFARAQQVSTMKERPNTKQSMIQDWYVVGPFANVKGTGFHTVYGPEKGQVDVKATYAGLDDKQVTWKHISPASSTGLGADPVDLLTKFTSKNDVCAYAYTRVFSDRDREVTLFTGSDDTITVWVNSKQVLAKNEYRGAVPDSESANIRLKKGTNDVLVKVCQGFGGWEFYLRFADEWGFPLTEGIRYGFAE